jgi:hypothetical protein
MQAKNNLTFFPLPITSYENTHQRNAGCHNTNHGTGFIARRQQTLHQ